MPSRNLNARKTKLELLALVFPFLVLLVLFNYLPLFGWAYAFFDFKPGVPLQDSPFVGLQYFQVLLEDGSSILRVLGNTLMFGFLGILCAPVPMFFAILLSEAGSPRFRRAVQTLTTLPNFISWVIVYSLGFALFSNDGMVSRLTALFGLVPGPSVLGDNDSVFLFQTLVGLWKSLGWSAIIYMAALAGIDEELYEAARIDGAGRFKIITSIVLPGLMPTFFVLLLLSVSNMLSVGFDQYLVFNNPLVSDHMEVIDLYVYKIGLAQNDISYGTVIGMAKSLVSIVLLFSVNFLAKRLRGQAIF